MTEKIGEKLKALRNAKKTTLKELSEGTGLSISYLSQVERGVSSVSINSLGKIAKVLGSAIDYFLEPPAIHEESVMRSYDQSVFTVDGSDFFYSRLSNDTMAGRILEPILLSVLPHKEKEPVEPACHEGEEFIYVMEGILTLYLGSERILLNCGDSAHYDSAIPHDWVNHTTRMVKLLAVSTPALFQQK